MVSLSVVRVRVRVIPWLPKKCTRAQSVVFSEIRTCAPACGVLWSWIQTALHCVVSHPCCSSLSPSTRRMGAATNGPAHGEGDTAGGYIRLCVPGLSPARVTLGVRLFHMFGFVLPHGAETRSRNAKHFTKASLVPPTQFETFPTQRAMSLAFSSESRDRAASRRRLPRVAQCRGRMGLKSFSPPPPRQHPACA